MFRDQLSGPRLLARWSFDAPRQDTGSGQAGERAAAGLTSVRGPAAAWHSGMSDMAAGCIWCGRD
jgi:hypothetical protein